MADACSRLRPLAVLLSPFSRRLRRLLVAPARLVVARAGVRAPAVTLHRKAALHTLLGLTIVMDTMVAVMSTPSCPVNPPSLSATTVASTMMGACSWEFATPLAPSENAVMTMTPCTS